MSRPDPLLFMLQQMTVDFSLINRNHNLLNTNEHESDTDHTLAVTLLCWYIHTKNKLDLNLEKVLKYAICHDLVEVYAGDTNSFAAPEDRKKKVILERQSLERISEEFKEFGDIVETMKNYEAKADPEALFVWTVDKLQALILGDMDGWRPFKAIDIDYDWFCQHHERIMQKASPHAKEIYETFVEYSKTTYYDQPKTKS